MKIIAIKLPKFISAIIKFFKRKKYKDFNIYKNKNAIA